MKKGFTLVELVIVIAFIGLLSTIMYKAVTQAPSNSGLDGLAQELPEPTNYAVDLAGVLSQEQLFELNAILEREDNTTRQYSVLILKTTEPYSIEQYGIKLAEKWKVGHEQLDNGAIIIIATEDRNVRIEIGKGLEQHVPDSAAGRIIDDYMMPSLKGGDWYGAVMGAITGLNERIK